MGKEEGGLLPDLGDQFIEIIGRYNPQTDPSTIDLDEGKVKDWLAKGAQPSDPVARLIKAAGIEA